MRRLARSTTRETSPGTPVVSANAVSLRFGGVHALQDVSLEIARGAIHAIIGPNGAGKTSLLNCLSGLYRPSAGTIVIDGVDVTQRRPRFIHRLGVTRTFQHLAVIGELTVRENLRLGALDALAGGVLSNGVRLPFERRRSRIVDERVAHTEQLLGLGGIGASRMGDLPYGVQKRVEVGRALMSEPRVLLLDEPMAGMTLEEKHELADVIARVRGESDLTIALIEHDVGVVMRLASEITVLNFGRVIAHGAPQEVRRHPEVIAAYLGTDRAPAASTSVRRDLDEPIPAMNREPDRDEPATSTRSTHVRPT